MIEIQSVSLQLGPFTLSDINLSIGDKEYFVILGPTQGLERPFLLSVLPDCIVSGREIYGWMNIMLHPYPQKEEK